VLGNDTDADGDSLTAVKITNPAHGAVTFNSNGSFSYTPVSTYTGSDSFTYEANDGLANSNYGTVTITVTPPPGSTATFGLDSGSVTFYDGGDKIEAQRFQNTAGDGTLTKLELLVDTAYGGKVRMAVYADDNGAPGALLVDAGEVTVSNGWVSISGLSAPVTGNTYYWLVFNMSYANQLKAQPSSGNTHRWVNIGYGAFPATFPSSDGVSTGYFVMRATVTK
jgi:VCBS repeat-containing protein